jgi:hypothetical protein
MADSSTAIKNAANAADARMVMMYPLVRVSEAPACYFFPEVSYTDLHKRYIYILIILP